MSSTIPTPVHEPERVPLRSRLLIGLAALCALVALLGVWADRQLLDTDDWTDTSAALLRDETIRTPVADEIAAAVADGSRATTALEDVLPPRLAPLAPQAGALVREAAQRATERLLATPQAQRLWEEANRAAHTQLVRFVEGDGRFATDDGVVLDLRPLAADIAQRAGFSGQRVERLPAGRAQIVVVQSDAIGTLRTAADVLGTLAWLPAVLAVLLYALALWLAPGARRRALLGVAATLVAAGLLVLVVRRVAGRELVDAVAGGGPYEPAARDAWRIATSLLGDLAAVVIIVGLAAWAGAWLAGPGVRAQALRGRVAPALASQGAAVYGGVALAYLALVAWGPLAVLRAPLAIVLFGALLVAGVALLRAQAQRELAAREAPPG